MTFRTTFRETRKSRQIALIVIFREKYARRILAIVSTISISNSASQTTSRPVWTLIPGVPIGCRSPRKRGPYSMPNDSPPQVVGDVAEIVRPTQETDVDCPARMDECLQDAAKRGGRARHAGMGVPIASAGHRRIDGEDKR